MLRSDTMEQIVSQQRQFFEAGHPLEIAFLKKQLIKIKGLLQENEEAFFEALHVDFKKPAL